MKQMKIFSLILGLFVTASSYSQSGAYSRDGAQNTLKYTKILFDEPFVFSKGGINLPGDKADHKPAVLDAIAASDQVIKEYDAKITEFLNSKPTAVILKNKFSVVTSKANGLQHAIQRAAEGFSEWRTLSSVSFLQELYLYQAFITGCLRVYPEAISLQEKLAEANAAIKQYESREAYMKKLEKNQLDYVKSLRMKKAVQSDAAVEAAAKKQYEASWAVDKVSVAKVHITSEWRIEKNGLDIPLHKEVEVNFAIKKGDGTCALGSAYMRCTYEGGGRYSAPSILMPGTPITVPCENIK